MSASLVGSEMCIRDSALNTRQDSDGKSAWERSHGQKWLGPAHPFGCRICLLYTSDAADDM
eukprot:14981992-Alexandrium_andersonii.AAC.1